MTDGGKGESKNSPPPWEWTELQLCREVYHCLPSALDGEDYDAIAVHLALLAEEGRYQNKPGKGKK